MLNIEYLKSNGIDYDKALERCVGNAGLYERILLRFASELETKLGKIQEAYKLGDYNEVHNIVHDLKGSGGNLGVTGIYDCSVAALTIIRGERYEELEAALDDFAAICRKTVETVNKAAV